MKQWILTLGCVAGLATMTVAANESTVKVQQPGKYDWLVQHPTIQALVARTNQHRAQMGRGPVTINPEMCLAAQRHATWMADSGAFQHSGLPYMEIIFNGPTSVEGAIQGWIASPAHHNIMLSGSEVGFGYQLRNGRPCWVGVFR